MRTHILIVARESAKTTTFNSFYTPLPAGDGDRCRWSDLADVATLSFMRALNDDPLPVWPRPDSPSDRQSNPPQPVRHLLTAEEYKAHRQELARLRELRNRELPDRLRATRSFVAADAIEELAQIQDEQAVVDARIRRLDELLQHADIAPDDSAAGVVSLGNSIDVEYLSTGRIVTYRLVGTGSSTNERGVSAGSPIGQALIGRSVGDTVAAELPNGRLETLRVLAVRAAPKIALTDGNQQASS